MTAAPISRVQSRHRRRNAGASHPLKARAGGPVTWARTAFLKAMNHKYRGTI
jgi:hypothetical protein